MERISSTRNPRIAYVAKLSARPSFRRTENLMVIEGLREVERAIAGGIVPVSLFFDEAYTERSGVPEKMGSLVAEEQCHIVTGEAFSRIAYRGSTASVVALAEIPAGGLSRLRCSDCPLILILESVEKPGNLGAVLRTADAAAADAVIVCDPATDLYNPNVIRSSLGCIFTVPTAVCGSEEAIRWLTARNISIYAAALQTDRLYHQPDYTGPSAFVFGTEATGLSDLWRNAAREIIRIPMLGVADSLNVSVSAAVLIYEARRQRSFNVQK